MHWQLGDQWHAYHRHAQSTRRRALKPAPVEEGECNLVSNPLTQDTCLVLPGETKGIQALVQGISTTLTEGTPAEKGRQACVHQLSEFSALHFDNDQHFDY